MTIRPVFAVFGCAHLPSLPHVGKVPPQGAKEEEAESF